VRALIIKNGRVIDPSQSIDQTADVLIEDGRIAALGLGLDGGAAEVIDASGQIVAPGLIDMHVQLREPGFEEDETIQSGTQAALAGGFATVMSLPNTDPPVDTQASVEFIQHQAEKSNHCRVLVAACVSKERQGEQLAEIGSLYNAGAVAVTDAPAPIHNPDLMRRALEYCQMFNLPVINHPEALELTKNGVMHAGLVSTRLALTGLSAASEDVMTGRDIVLTESTAGCCHLANISSEGSVEMVRRAKRNHVNITAGVSAAHLCLTDESFSRFDSNYKVKPPLRSEEHRQACLDGLADGTLDVITSSHAPRAREKKLLDLGSAPFGMIGLQTVVPLVVTHLIKPNVLDWPAAIAALSTNPAQILNQDQLGTLRVSTLADVTVIDPATEWILTADVCRSKSLNSPFLGHTMTGLARYVIVDGEIRFTNTAGLGQVATV
jgi:dihydroorotase